MSDVALRQDKLRYDISVELGDLLSDEGFETAVIISLFTDRRVLDEELDTSDAERRGWWGDSDEISDYPGDLIGSKLWLLDRAKRSEETRNRAEAYAKEALQWFLDDGIAESISVKATLVNATERIDLEICIQRPKTKNIYYYRYQLVWDGQLSKGGNRDAL